MQKGMDLLMYVSNFVTEHTRELAFLLNIPCDKRGVNEGRMA